MPSIYLNYLNKNKITKYNSITEYYVLIPVVQVQDKTIGLVHFISIYATACFVKTGLKAKVTTNMAFF